MNSRKIDQLLRGEKRFPKSDSFHEATKISSYPKGEKEEYYPRSWIKINYKTYPRLKRIKLPPPLKLKANLERTILSRRSKREFSCKRLTPKELSSLLLFSGGLTYQKNEDWDKSLRAYPSAGARYPLEIYLAVNRVESVENGLYHYNVKEHSLELLRKGDFDKMMAKTTDQEWVGKAGVVILISAVLDRTRVKYKDRGYRFILMEAGHLAQNIHLMSEALNLSSCAIGGFIDDELNKLLDLEGTCESVVYLVAVGHGQ